MPKSRASAGTFRNGLPYNRLGQGPRDLVVFHGLQFESKPLTGLSARMMLRSYDFLRDEYTTYVVGRRPGLPDGYLMPDMADDYATMIREELRPPVDVIGISTGGSIALHFAADHSYLLRRLVLHSSAYTLCDAGKEVQMSVAHLALGGKWREASAALIGFSMPASLFGRVSVALGSFLISMAAPKDPSDLVVTIEAEDKVDFRDRLDEIAAPTLVVGGAEDPFYTGELFRETAEGIPNATLILYEGMGHPASGKEFERDVLSFLREGTA